MKTRSKTYICAVLCVLPSMCFAQTAQTIDECVTTALTHNYAIQLSKQNADAAEGRVKEARSTANPHLGMFGYASDRSAEINLPLAVGIDNQQLVTYNFPYVPQAVASYGVSVSQVLDFSGMIRTGTHAAQANAQSANLMVTGTRNDVVMQTKMAYYDMLRSQEMLAVAEEAMRNAVTRKHTAESLVETGIASKVDTIRADAAISAAQQSVINATNAIQVTKSIINRMMGMDVNAPLELVKPADQAVTLGSYETYLTEALNNRPELAIAGKNALLAKLNHKLAGRDMSPSVVLSATAKVDAAERAHQDSNASVALTVSVPVFDGGQRSGRLEQAKAGIRSAATAEEDTKAAITLQVRVAYVHVQNASEKLTTASKGLEQATESLRLSRARYAEGMASQVELSDAELAFTQAQSNLVNARYDQLSSQVELDRAVGRYTK